MVKSYAKGYANELKLTHKLASMGFMAIRAPRSGRINLPSPDIVAAKAGKLFVIECKAREEAFTVEKEQLQELLDWQEKAGAKAYIAWKLSRKDWTFLHLKDVIENNGNIGKKFAGQKGFGIEALLN